MDQLILKLFFFIFLIGSRVHAFVRPSKAIPKARNVSQNFLDTRGMIMEPYEDGQLLPILYQQ